MKLAKRRKDKKGTELHPNTVMINNMQREKSRESVRNVLSWLTKTFPKAFDVDGAIRPLKVGIFEDIMEYAKAHEGLPFSMTKLRKALVVFTRRMEYLTCVKMRDTRIDLQGNEVEPVSEEAAKLAVQKIKKIIEKNLRARRKSAVSNKRPERFGQRSGSSTGRSHFSSHGNTGYHHNPYESGTREHVNPYHQDADAQPSATIKVKRRYPRNHHANPYHAPQEKNYNSESYNTPASTVDRLKAKLGLKPRRERFDYEDNNY